MNKLTKVQRAALQWFFERDPVGLFDRWAPTKITRDRLEKAGLIERVSDPHRTVGLIKYRISAAGRKALEASNDQ